MRVGFVQMNPRLLDVEGNVDKALRLLKRVKADLVVLPELFNTGYNFSSKKHLRKVAEPIPEGFTSMKLLEASKDHNTAIVAGIAEKKGSTFFNSAAVFRSRYMGTYRKVHLFKHEKKFFRRGHEFRVFPGNIGVMVCFDWFYPEGMRTLMLKGARVIAHPANLVMHYCPDAMKTRCLENRVFAVTADRVGSERGLKYIGKSQIVDPKGRVVYRASSDREETIVREIDPVVAANKNFTKLNNIVRDRSPTAYA